MIVNIPFQEEITFGTGNLDDGFVNTFFEDGMDFKLFDIQSDTKNITFDFLTFNDTPLGPDPLELPLFENYLDDDGIWVLKEPEDNLVFPDVPGISVKPALNFSIDGGVEIDAPTLASGQIEPFDTEFELMMPDQFVEGETVEIGVIGANSDYNFTGEGISLGNFFAGAKASYDSIGIEELIFTSTNENDDPATISKDYFDDETPWPFFEGSGGADLSFGITSGGEFSNESELDLGPLSLTSDFEAGQTFEATGGDSGQITDRILSLKAGVIDILKYQFPPLELLNGDVGWSTSFGPLEANLELVYNIFEYTLDAGIDFVQDFSFDPEYVFDYKIDDQVVFSGGVGDTFNYTPQSNDSIDIDVDLNVTGTFGSSFSLDSYFGGETDFLNFNGKASVGAWLFSEEFDVSYDFFEEIGIDDPLEFEAELPLNIELGELQEQSTVNIIDAFSLSIPFGEEPSLDIQGTMSFADIAAISGFGGLNGALQTVLSEKFDLDDNATVSDVVYTGSGEAAFAVGDFRIDALQTGLSSFDYGSGIMLSSGGFPGASNTVPNFGVLHETAGDPDLTATAQAAFSGAGGTNDPKFDSKSGKFAIFNFLIPYFSMGYCAKASCFGEAVL